MQPKIEVKELPLTELDRCAQHPSLLHSVKPVCVAQSSACEASATLRRLPATGREEQIWRIIGVKGMSSHPLRMGPSLSEVDDVSKRRPVCDCLPLLEYQPQTLVSEVHSGYLHCDSLIMYTSSMNS